MNLTLTPVGPSPASTSYWAVWGGVDKYGQAPDMPYHINVDVLISELRRIHHLTGYGLRSVQTRSRKTVA